MAAKMPIKRVITGVISLVLIIVFFSGYFGEADGLLLTLDFTDF